MNSENLAYDDMMQIEPNNYSNLDIEYLGDDFYAGTRNELTQKRLYDLAILAKEIPEPILFGQYKDDAHYAQTLDLMLGSTQETRHRGIFFNRKVLPQIINRDSLLDIGPGNGQLTCWIGNKFKYVTAIDSNADVMHRLNENKQTLRKHIILNKICDSVLNVKMRSNYYDLSIISHVLYYIDRDMWLEMVKRVYNATKPNGLVVIALSGDKFGKADLIRHFGGETLDINSLAKDCMQSFTKDRIKVFATKEAITTINLTAMLHIAGFFLCDAGITSTKHELINYLNKSCSTVNNNLVLTTQQKFIVIQKEP